VTSSEVDPGIKRGPNGQLWQAIAELGQVLRSETSPQSMLQRVAVLAAATIEAVDEVGITTPGVDRPVTDAATSGLVFEVDNFQYELGEGPCLHSLRTGEVVEVADMGCEHRWSVYCTFAADHGLNSSLSFPLGAGGEHIGVVNLYARRTGCFSEQERWEASMFAMQAGAALASQRALDASTRLNAQLEEALQTRSVIEQAKGVLMERHGDDADAAFERLKRDSQQTNRKLQVIAAEVVAGAGGMPPARRGARGPDEPHAPLSRG
jgi:GAF domain-containing protein